MSEYKSMGELELLGLLAQSDEAAFEEIYTRYDILLYLYAFRKLNSREEAKDIVQEVFISLWNSRHDFVLRSSLSGYLYKSVLNRVLNVFKHQHITLAYANANPRIEADPAETDHLIREKQIAQLIQQEIDAMPPRMKEIYELKRKHYLTTKEIAELLNLSEHTVSTQLKNALKHLRIKLGIVIFILYIVNR